jgi:ubiquinone/menaquinone biosynthesis C-methylase UbiE
MPEKTVKQFWNEQAIAFQESDLATAPDHYYREMEIERILSHLKNGASILDVGCGNGYSTLRFARALPASKIMGIDFSESMIDHATAALAKHELRGQVEFSLANVLSLTADPIVGNKKFDFVVSERCLINLGNWEEQRAALLQMKALLNPNGQIILTENTQEGLANLNGLRENLGLPPIAVRWHNYYMPQKTLEAFLPEHFWVEAVENIGNLYYIISRVVYAKLADLEGKQPEYLHPINKIAAQLPSLPDGRYSPNYIYVLRNRT